MGKLVVLTFAEGDLDKTGFPVTLQMGDEGKPATIQETGSLPPNPELIESYTSWKVTYYSFLGIKVRVLKAKAGQITNFSIGDVNKKADNLSQKFNQWLKSPQFSHVREELIAHLKEDDEVRLIIQTSNLDLRKLPWHLWDILERYPKAEISVSAPNFRQVRLAKVANNQVKILAILGDDDGINVEADRKFLDSIPGAKVKFLVKPNRQELNDLLWEQSWDILFFAGHSRTEGETGILSINKTESLTIPDLRYALKKAIEKGLQLAIFNSCDGLGLAQDLADLNLPQMIVMREPVPDKVAQEFLKYFLGSFSGGQSFYLAVREAREQLQGLESHFPCASWLPVICQNPAEQPLTRQNLQERRLYPGWKERITTDIKKYRLRELTIVFLAILIAILTHSYNVGKAPSISYRHLTGINGYPTLTLSLLKPTLEDKVIKKILSEVLEIEHPPLVYSDNPVFESVERFKHESGNDGFISEENSWLEKPNNSSINYNINEKNVTKIGEISLQNSTNSEKLSQSRQQYFNNTMGSENHFSTLLYALFSMPFQDSIEDAAYTSLVKSPESPPNFILQYPKFSEVDKLAGSYGLFGNKTNIWIQQIIKNNPNARGFFAFLYLFQENPNYNIFNDDGACLTSPLTHYYSILLMKLESVPYIKFIDVKNLKSYPVNIKSINYNLLNKSPYELTVMDRRELLFKKKSTKINKDLNIDLAPGQHLFIPIEFGFYTMPQNTTLAKYIDLDNSQKIEISQKVKPLYISQPLPESIYNQLEQPPDSELERAKINKYLLVSKNLSKNFVAQTSTLEELLNKIPKRFAVGSILNVSYLEINGTKIMISPPKDEPIFTISSSFAAGC